MHHSTNRRLSGIAAGCRGGPGRGRLLWCPGALGLAGLLRPWVLGLAGLFAIACGSGSGGTPGTDAGVPTSDSAVADGQPGTDGSGCGVSITHTPVTSAPLGDILIEAGLSGATEILLWYRLVGREETFSSIGMMVSGANHAATIPGDLMTFAGVDYYIEASGNGCTVTEPATGHHHVRTYGERRLTTQPGVYEYLPSVYGHQVVFSKERSAGDEDDLLLFDLHTFGSSAVTTGPKAQGAGTIFGDLVVWVDSRNQAGDDNLDIYLQDLSAGVESAVTTDPRGQYGVTMFDRIIAWRDDRHMTGPINGDIYLYDLGPDLSFCSGDDGGEFRVTSNTHDQTAPRLFVDATGRVKVVWADMRDDADGICDANCDWNIYLYDSGPDTLFGTADDLGPAQVTSEANEQTSPEIYGSRIVWRDARGGNWLKPEIYLYDLGLDGVFGTADDLAERPLGPVTEEPDHLDLWEDLLVYDDYRNGSYEIYLFDFASGTETALTDSPGGQFYPRIHERTVVWQDTRHNAPPPADPADDIYVYVLP